MLFALSQKIVGEMEKSGQPVDIGHIPLILYLSIFIEQRSRLSACTAQAGVS